jgi:hypothetical protein
MDAVTNFRYLQILNIFAKCMFQSQMYLPADKHSAPVS